MKNREIIRMATMFHIGSVSPKRQVSSVNPMGTANRVAPTMACKMCFTPNLVLEGSIWPLKVAVSSEIRFTFFFGLFLSLFVGLFFFMIMIRKVN